MQTITSHKKSGVINIEAEMIALYHSLQNELRDNSNFAIQVISAHREEGVSTIIHEFAGTMVKIFGKSVFVLDLDSKVAEQQGTASEDNVAQHENSDSVPFEQSIKEELADGYSLGHLPWKKAGLSVIHNNNYFEKILSSLKKKYDIVLLDTPPPSESPIGLAVAGKVDGVILVVAAETTRWPVVERLKQQIAKVGGLILGSVLNKQKRYIPGFIYKRYI